MIRDSSNRIQPGIIQLNFIGDRVEHRLNPTSQGPDSHDDYGVKRFDVDTVASNRQQRFYRVSE